MLPKEYFTFFKNLQKNNNKEWFDSHKKDYERFVKEPFRELVQQLIDKIRTVEPRLAMQAKDAVFRINRDIRFSPDKTPYKTHCAAHISIHGKGAVGIPGFYLQVGAKDGGIGGGCYMPDKEQLMSIRDLIMHEGKTLRKLLADKKFVNTYGELQGAKNKILPAEFKAAAIDEPLLFNKQFYWWKVEPSATFTNAKCVATLFEYYKVGRPLQEYFTTAL
jgi:uncharacterized protein (TIGR02453 family)